jgi:hypothetical protein
MRRDPSLPCTGALDSDILLTCPEAQTTRDALAALDLLVPYSPVARLLGMVPLPPGYLLFVALVVPSYLVLVELLKGRLLRRVLTSRPQRRRGEGMPLGVPARTGLRPAGHDRCG